MGHDFCDLVTPADPHVQKEHGRNGRSGGRDPRRMTGECVGGGVDEIANLSGTINKENWCRSEM